MPRRGATGFSGLGAEMMRSLVLSALVLVSAGQTVPYATDVKFQPAYRRQSWCSRQRAVLDGNSTMSEALKGAKLSVVFTPREGWFEQDDQGNPVAGIHVKLMDEVASRAGFTWRDSFAVVDQPDTTESDETWTDWLLWGSSNYDVVAEWFNDKPSRRGLGVTFPDEFLDTSLLLVSKQSEGGASLTSRLFSFLLPFKPQVWWLMLGIMVYTSVIYEMIEGSHGGEDFPSHHRNFYKDMRHALFLSCAGFTGAGEFNPETSFGRLFKLSYTFMILLLTSAYTANLASFLIVRNQVLYEISGISEANARKLILCVDAGSSNHEYMKSVWPKIPLHTTDSQVGSLKAVNDGKCVAAVMGKSEWEEVKLQLQANPDCDMGIVDIPFKKWGASWASKSDSAHMCTNLVAEVLSLHLQEMTVDGFIGDTWLSYLNNKYDSTCSTERDEAEEDSERLGIADTGGLFMVHGLVSLMAVAGHIAAVLEKRKMTAPEPEEEQEDQSNKRRSLDNYVANLVFPHGHQHKDGDGAEHDNHPGNHKAGSHHDAHGEKKIKGGEAGDTSIQYKSQEPTAPQHPGHGTDPHDLNLEGKDEPESSGDSFACDVDLAHYKQGRQEDLIKLMSVEIINQKTELAELKKMLKTIHNRIVKQHGSVGADGHDNGERHSTTIDIPCLPQKAEHQGRIHA